MKSKQSVREQLEADMAVFLAQGGKVTKCNTIKPLGSRRTGQPKEKVAEVEIDTDVLPKALLKFMGV